jgi:hypothetical protein
MNTPTIENTLIKCIYSDITFRCIEVKIMKPACVLLSITVIVRLTSIYFLQVEGYGKQEQ